MSGAARRDISGYERAVAALTGYVAGSIVVVPFDRIKTLMQASPGAHPCARQLARDVLRTDGLRGLYRGMDTQLLIAPYTVVYYCLYDELLRLQQDHPMAPLSAAVVARTLEVTLRMPLELLRTQLQAAEGQLSLRSLLRQHRHQPLSSWMQGYSPTLLRDVPFSAIYWWAYESIKKEVPAPSRIPGEGLRTLTHSFICGGAAGMMAALVTCPIDVIKTLRQKTLTGAERSLTTAMPASESYKDIIQFLIAHPKTSFSGVGPRLLRIPLGMATMMSAMETSKWAFEWRRQSRNQEPLAPRELRNRSSAREAAPVATVVLVSLSPCL